MKKKIFQLLLLTIGNALPVSYYPFGKFGKKFRYFCAKNFVKDMGKNCNIEKGAQISSDLSIGDYSGVGVNCMIQANTIIGKGVTMGPDCMVYTKNHKFNAEKQNYNDSTIKKQVVIEDDVWLGARVIILPGVTIGKCSTIGAGSIVTKNIPPYSVAVGNPAVVKKSLM